MTKAKELLYPVGIDSLFLAMMVGGKDTRDVIPTYEPIERYDVISELGIAGDPKTATKWASNKLFVNATRNAKYTLNLSYVALPQAIIDKINGVVAEKGVVIDTDNIKEYPMFAVGFIATLNNGSKVARWYPRVQKNPTEETFTTIGDEVEIKDQTLNMTATALLKNRNTLLDFSEVRDSATGITAEDFMKQVICDKSQLATLGKPTTP